MYNHAWQVRDVSCDSARKKYVKKALSRDLNHGQPKNCGKQWIATATIDGRSYTHSYQKRSDGQYIINGHFFGDDPHTSDADSFRMVADEN